MWTVFKIRPQRGLIYIIYRRVTMWTVFQNLSISPIKVLSGVKRHFPFSPFYWPIFKNPSTLWMDLEANGDFVPIGEFIKGRVD